MNLLEKNLDKGIVINEGNLGGTIMSVVFGTILIVGVLIPIVVQVTATSNLTGIAATIVGFMPVFGALAGLGLIAGLVYFGK